MNNGAMYRAFQMIRKKPVILLLLLPIHAVSLLTFTFMPDFSQMLNSINSLDSSAMMSFQMKNMLYVLASSMISLISLAGLFVLMPPAMELLSDGAAGRETGNGWYSRGLRKHWWKPVVVNLITGAIMGVIMIILYIAIAVILGIFIGIWSGARYGGNDANIDLNDFLGGIMPAMLAGGVIFGSVLFVVTLLFRSFFALFLPALADRGFGEAFKLMFSRKGLRKFPRVLGGFLVINLVSGLIVTTFGAGHILLAGIPSGPFGPLVAILNFLRSWTGAFALLLGSVISIMQFPFQFSVYQTIKDEETAAMIKN